MVKSDTIQFFRFDADISPATALHLALGQPAPAGIVVFVSDLADRHGLSDEDFTRNLPPRYDADDFFDWCGKRSLPISLENEDDNLYNVEVFDPTLRFEFRLRWGQ